MSRLLRLASAWLAAAVVAGCAIVANVPPGLPDTELVARYGKPTATHPLPDGSTNYEYSQQPFGQYLWMVKVRGGRVETVRQVLTDREFATVKVGVDTKDTILAHFGSPAETAHFYGGQREAWSYRYKAEDVFPALMTVQFDTGGIVREVFSGFDPLRDGGGDPGGEH